VPTVVFSSITDTKESGSRVAASITVPFITVLVAGCAKELIGLLKIKYNMVRQQYDNLENVITEIGNIFC